MKTPEIHVIYCDDIRFEIGSKQSYIGVYLSEFLVPEFPTVVPKLFAQVNVRIPLEIELNSLELQCNLGSDSLNKISIEPDQLVQMRQAVKEMFLKSHDDVVDDDEGFLGISVVFNLNSIQLTGPTRIRVRALLNGEEFKGNALMIRQQTAQERAELLASSPS